MFDPSKGGSSNLAQAFIGNKATQPTSAMPQISQPVRQPMPMIGSLGPVSPIPAPSQPTAPAGYTDLSGQRIHLPPGQRRREEMPMAQQEAIAAARAHGTPGQYAPGTYRTPMGGFTMMPQFGAGAAPVAPAQPSQAQLMARAINDAAMKRGR